MSQKPQTFIFNYHFQLYATILADRTVLVENEIVSKAKGVLLVVEVVVVVVF